MESHADRIKIFGKLILEIIHFFFRKNISKLFWIIRGMQNDSKKNHFYYESADQAIFSWNKTPMIWGCFESLRMEQNGALFLVIILSIASSNLSVSYFLRLGFYLLNLIWGLIYAWVTEKWTIGAKQWEGDYHMVKSVAIPDSTFLDKSIRGRTGVLWGTCDCGRVTITDACVAKYKFYLRAL